MFRLLRKSAIGVTTGDLVGIAGPVATEVVIDAQAVVNAAEIAVLHVAPAERTG